MKAIARMISDPTAKTRVVGRGSKSLNSKQKKAVERVSNILESASMRAVILLNRTSPARTKEPEYSVEIGIVKPFSLLIQ